MEKEEIVLEPCRVCGGKANVRRAKHGWWYVGCTECWNKTQVDDALLDYAVELWHKRVKR